MKQSLIAWIGLVAVMVAASPAWARVIPVESPEKLEAAVSRARPGDEVVLAAGRYDAWQVELDGRGARNRPIVIRPETVGTVVFTGETHLLVTGAYLTLRDFQFDGASSGAGTGIVDFSGSNHCRITRSSFIKASPSGLNFVVRFESGAADNRVDHCVFKEIQTRSVGVIITDASLKTGPPVRNRIDHNLFMDIPPLGRNGGETIQIGSRAYPYDRLESHTLVENNTFLRANGEGEIISVKASANVFRGNRFLHCRGQLSLRHGLNNTVQDNLFVDCNIGVRISGSGHVVTGNTMIDSQQSGIVLWYGTPDDQHPAAYLPVFNCRIEGNTIINSTDSGILVGAYPNRKWHSERWATMSYGSRNAHLQISVAPYDNVITGNTIIGPAEKLLIIEAESTNNRIEGNHLIPTDAAADAGE